MLLVDADLRNPSLHAKLRRRNAVGLGDYLAGRCNPPETFQATSHPNLAFMSAGAVTANAADLLGASLEFLGFGIDSLLQPSSLSVDATVDIERAVSERLDALNAKDFAKADTIRAQLLTLGVQLMDYKDEAGQRQTKWELKP